MDYKGKGKAIPLAEPRITSASEPSTSYDSQYEPSQRANERWTFAEAWNESRKRARSDKQSWDYVLSSGVAGGIAGCVAKTAIAPLDRVKILFQTSNADFQKYAGSPMGLIHATGRIYRDSGVRGLFQGHSVTLLRIFPYAGIKFMAYDWSESVLIPTPDKRTPERFFLAGAFSGVTSVLITYPLELIRVRLAFQTRQSERTSLREAVRSIYAEHHQPLPSVSSLASNTSSSSAATAAPALASVSRLTRSFPLFPFYRGFSITIIGMVPYAGVSFLTYGTLKRCASEHIEWLRERRTVRDLACGAVAGAVSQTASYPFEVVRRRMQVGGARGGSGVSWRQAIRSILDQRGWRGFFVGLSIGYLKVVPMTSISFATWQVMKRAFEI